MSDLTVALKVSVKTSIYFSIYMTTIFVFTLVISVVAAIYYQNAAPLIFVPIVAAYWIRFTYTTIKLLLSSIETTMKAAELSGIVSALEEVRKKRAS